MKKFPYLLFCGLLLTLAARAQTPITWTADSVRLLDEFAPTKDYTCPWLSADGLRLYIVQNGREARVARRPTPHARFGPSQPVRGVPVGQFLPNRNELLAATYSGDERTIWYTLSGINTCNDRLYYRTRPSDTATFGPEHRIYLDNTGNPFVSCTDGSLRGAVLSQNQQELYVTMDTRSSRSAIVRFRAVGVDSFTYAGFRQEPPAAFGGGYGASQLIDGDLALLTTGGSNPRQIRQLTRAAAQDTFGSAQPVALTVAPASASAGAEDMFYQPGCRQLVTVERTPTLRVMYLFTNVARSRVQQIGAAALAAPLALTPNPAHHTVGLTGLPPGATTAYVIDALGRTVRTSDLAPQTSNLSLEGLPPGLYTVRVGAAARRLVVE